MSSDDPTRPESRWSTLHRLLAEIDGQIAELYTQRGISGVRPRFVLPLVRLAHTGPLTIRALALELDRTHSAMSQTVAALRRDGFVETVPGADGRTREVTLTDRARRLVPLMEAEWRATEAAVDELDDEVDHPLSVAARDTARALAARPMIDRLHAHLVEPPAEPEA